MARRWGEGGSFPGGVLKERVTPALFLKEMSQRLSASCTPPLPALCCTAGWLGSPQWWEMSPPKSPIPVSSLIRSAKTSFPPKFFLKAFPILSLYQWFPLAESLEWTSPKARVGCLPIAHNLIKVH